MIYILGLKGNMGQRYKAIANSLGFKVEGHDIEDHNKEKMFSAQAFIVATPTERHLEDVKSLFAYEKPILCEKPLSKNLEELEKFEDDHRPDLALLTMVNQYHYMNKRSQGYTEYNYFKSGKDGLAWDCINVIGMAVGPVALDNKLPYWHCKLNGSTLNSGLMDYAYISMVKDWLNAPQSNWAYAKRAHEKVVRYIKENSF